MANIIIYCFIVTVVFIVDDGTGLKECVKFFNINDPTPYSNITLGELVAVKGVLAIGHR